MAESETELPKPGAPIKESSPETSVEESVKKEKPDSDLLKRSERIKRLKEIKKKLPKSRMVDRLLKDAIGEKLLPKSKGK